MIVGSFRLVAFSLIFALLLVACGSSSGKTGAPPPGRSQTVQGPGFAFEAPADWRLGHALTSATALSRGATPASVSAQVFRLGKTYAPSDFGSVTAELDSTARRLAATAGGKVTEAETTTVAGSRIRAYRFTSHGGENRIGFLLVGKRELQLLCQAPHGGDPDGACALLFRTFRLTR